MHKQVHSLVGAQVRKHLPAGLNPKMLEQLEADFAAQSASPAAAAGGAPAGRADGSVTPLGGGRTAAPARPASPPVPAVARRLSGTAASPAAAPRHGKSAGAADRNGQAAATEARSGKAAAESRNSKAAAAAAPVTVLASAHASSHYSLADYAYPVNPPSYHDGGPFDQPLLQIMLHALLSSSIHRILSLCKTNGMVEDSKSTHCVVRYQNLHVPLSEGAPISGVFKK